MKEIEDAEFKDAMKSLNKSAKIINEAFQEFRDTIKPFQKSFDEIEVVETPKMDFEKLNKMLSKPSRKSRKKK